MIVVDASAAAEWLLDTPKAGAVRARAIREDALVAPHLIDVEVLQAFRNLTAAGILDPVRARDALTDLAEMRMTRYPHFALLPRIWELRHNLSAYDAAYVALAEAMDAPLLTCDRKLSAASGHRAKIHLI